MVSGAEPNGIGPLWKKGFEGAPAVLERLALPEQAQDVLGGLRLDVLLLTEAAAPHLPRVGKPEAAGVWTGRRKSFRPGRRETALRFSGVGLLFEARCQRWLQTTPAANRPSRLNEHGRGAPAIACAPASNTAHRRGGGVADHESELSQQILGL